MFVSTAVNFLYFPCYGTMRLPSPFVFYAFVDIPIRFFDTDQSLLIRFSVIAVKQKEVVTLTSVRYSCKTSKASKTRTCYDPVSHINKLTPDGGQRLQRINTG